VVATRQAVGRAGAAELGQGDGPTLAHEARRQATQVHRLGAATEPVQQHRAPPALGAGVLEVDEVAVGQLEALAPRHERRRAPAEGGEDRRSMGATE